MRVSSLVAVSGMFLLATSPVIAEDFVWRDPQGKPVPDSDHQKSVQGFGGLLLLTQDADWKEKWARPEPPRFTGSDTVKLGEKITALVFFVNALKDAGGNVHLQCDFLITRPDGSISTDAQDVDCFTGPVSGSDHNLRLVGVTPEFIGEAADLPGTWTINVRLTDTVRDVAVELQAPFEYQKPAN
jgi:hypothetical protein